MSLRIVRFVVAFAFAFVFVARTASASTLVTWEFSGPLAFAPSTFGLAARYPPGTPVTYDVTFDPASPKIVGDDQRGLYKLTGSATLHMGDTTLTSLGAGYLAVNCAIYNGCYGVSPHNVEFWNTGWTQLLNPNDRQSLLVSATLEAFDSLVTTGAIPSVPAPSGILRLGVGGLVPGDAQLVVRGGIHAFENDPQVPEPGTVILLASGLMGLGARRWKGHRYFLFR